MVSNFSLTGTSLAVIPLAPLAGAIIAGLFGKLVGRTGAHLVTIAGVAVSFVVSLLVWFAVQDGASFNQTLYTWMQVGSLKMEVGFQVDGLTALMMCVVTFVSLMVHIYTIGYMADDPGYQRFFSYISLFTFSMLMLVMSNNFLQLFFGWEAVGLVSYLLIGFWFTRESAIFANLKAFLVNRVGDFGFILGIALIAAYTGSLNYTEVFAQAEQLSGLVFHVAGAEWNLLTVICIGLFIGAMGKSAQFPLHVWLPDSMEGPTPISALIHAATMVTAGIFMVSRMSPLFELSDTALSLVLVVGGITALFMGFLGIIQTDIKRVVAYSTLSQLGYMTVGLGASAYSVAIFHLMTHAFFKALLFLAAGSVIIGMHHNQNILHMGGLRKYMPITWITSLVGSLALIGTPFLSGFYSKDSIIEAVHASQLPGAGFAYLCVLSGVFVTAFYSFRMYFLVFHGQERFHAHLGHGHDGHAAGAHHADAHVPPLPHESPWVVTLPLVLLAIPSLFIGYFAEAHVLSGDWFGQAIAVVEPHEAMAELRQTFHGSAAMGLHAFVTLPFYLALIGVLLAWYLYLRNPALAERLKQKFLPLWSLLDHKYYLDWFNENIIARGSRWLGVGLWQGGDRFLIDGVAVGGSSGLVRLTATVTRWLQTGSLPFYILFMAASVLLMLAYYAPGSLTAWLAHGGAAR